MVDGSAATVGVLLWLEPEEAAIEVEVAVEPVEPPLTWEEWDEISRDANRVRITIPELPVFHPPGWGHSRSMIRPAEESILGVEFDLPEVRRVGGDRTRPLKTDQDLPKEGEDPGLSPRGWVS